MSDSTEEVVQDSALVDLLKAINDVCQRHGLDAREAMEICMTACASTMAAQFPVGADRKFFLRMATEDFLKKLDFYLPHLVKS